jgi:hypothetical protein
MMQFPDTLVAETSYRWKVFAETDAGETAESDRWTFATGTGFNNPPGYLRFTSPWVAWDPRIDIPLDAVLTWECFDPDGETLTYELYYRQDEEDDSTHVSGLTEPEFSTPLDADTQYEINVWAVDGHGASGFRNWVNFYTVTTPPPHDPYPADGATDMPPELVLSWSCTDPDGDDLTYDVEMGRAGSAMNQVASSISQDELPVVGLWDGSTYQWKVTAEDDDGHRTEGPVWTFTTAGGSDVIFADLTLTRRQSKSGIELTVIDNIVARFDEEYAPRFATRPLQPAAVTCGGYDLYWQDTRFRYYYESTLDYDFLVPGTEYTFTITEGDGVPSHTEAITFPECAPLITSPASYDPISLTGFTVNWSGFDDFTDCDRQVSITILEMSGDSTGVYVTTDNDGSYTFTAGELSAIDPSTIELQIVLIVENVRNIDAAGYDPRSWIRARTLTYQTIYVE